MSGLAVDNFLLSFAVAFGQLAGQAIDAVRPRSMWLYQAVEADSTGLYTVIRPYNMPADPVGQTGRQPSLSVQLDTRGMVCGAVYAESARLAELLRDPAGGDGPPRWRWAVAGKKMIGGAIAADPAGSWIVNSVLPVSGPGLTGVDDQGRFMASSNFDLVFYFSAA